ncbi:MAG: ribulose-phosphate 3-epimerase, partial [Firmicutes bacterium]|nr:ribulose-phosphate 3-epimerase [Bacillota bacterium]
DMVLVMTVEPGFGGQKIIYETLDKISEINKFALENNINLDIEADGGINFDNVKLVLNSEANVIVIGSALFKLNLKMREKKIIEFYEASKNFF